jgi:hypothetical protein
MTRFDPVQRLIEAWVRLYTLGLPAMHRTQRHDLILADVYEQLHDPDETAGGLTLLARCLRGVPDDVTWRLFEARRLPAGLPMAVGAGETEAAMNERTSGVGAGFFAIAAGIAWASVFVLLLQPVPHSLAYVAGLASLIALTGWLIEARGTPRARRPIGVAAAPGRVDREHRRWHRGCGRSPRPAVGRAVRDRSDAGAIARTGDNASQAAEPDTAAAPNELMRHAAQGQAIAIESKPHRGVSRRILLRGSVTLGIGSVLAMMGGVVTDFLWQRNVSGFGGVVTAEPVGDSRPAARRAFWKASSGS